LLGRRGFFNREDQYPKRSSKFCAGDGKGVIRLIDVMTGEVRHILEAHDCAVASLSFEPENGNLISVNCDGNSISWDISEGREIK